MRTMWERRQKKEEIQVFVIPAAEKKRGKVFKDRTNKKKHPLQRRFFWFCVFQMIILWSVNGCVHMCVFKCVCAFCMIQSVLKCV